MICSFHLEVRGLKVRGHRFYAKFTTVALFVLLKLSIASLSYSEFMEMQQDVFFGGCLTIIDKFDV